MSATNLPDHVLEYNRKGEIDRQGGFHFDDPRFDPSAQAQPIYRTELKKTAPRPASETDHDVMARWLRTQTWSDFAQSLADFHEARGYLTEKQYASAQSMRIKVEARQAERTQAQPSGGTLDLSDLPDGRYAIPGGDTRLKVMVNRPGENSKWHGWIFVSDGAEYGSRQNYGRQAPSGKYQGKIEDQLKAILSDPREAMARYGQLTGQCGMCNRKLEDEESVRLGIGPICRNK